MAFIKRLVTKARRGNIIKIYINKAAFIAGLVKAAHRV
jgi:DNA-binding transcriptional regulator LsrR (DeoR family)